MLDDSDQLHARGLEKSQCCLYFECLSGISGDMVLSALADLGVDFDPFLSELNRSFGTNYRLDIIERTYHGIGAKGLSLNLGDLPQSSHRKFSDICARIEGSGFCERVKTDAVNIFKLLAHAEANIHRSHVDEVHFHEVGADDAIIDILGAAFAIQMLRVDRIVSSEIVVGCGHVKCDHGNMPLPAPATQSLLEGLKIRQSEIRSELTTPTGAAILKHYLSDQDPLSGKLVKTGIGSGSRSLAEQPNILRASIFDLGRHIDQEVFLLETNIDDATAEIIADATSRFFSLGALDVWTESLIMKKGRQGTKISCLILKTDIKIFQDAVFSHLPTFGMRWTRYYRRTADRHTIEVEIDCGHPLIDTQILAKSGRITSKCSSIRVKVRDLPGRVPLCSPEYVDCSVVASQLDIPVYDVMRLAWQAAIDKINLSYV